jgi:hypothetical protein
MAHASICRTGVGDTPLSPLIAMAGATLVGPVVNHADLPVVDAKDSDRAKPSAFQWGAVAVRGLPVIQYSFGQYRILQKQCIINQVNLMQPIINYATF